jgi:L,D-peptidoglycan transpeptidase YkuD (ErfK/YbiS/YcfS/YnhG family)
LILVDGRAETLTLWDFTCACTIGKGGLIAAVDKREGDGASPMGDWPVRSVLLRPGRISVPAGLTLPWRWIRDEDGWCDDPADAAYNRPVQLPRATSHERLARDDQAYDAVVVLGHNDSPPVPGMGSAIFFHQWAIGADGAPKATEGCVAVAPASMRAILPMLTPGMVMRIG